MLAEAVLISIIVGLIFRGSIIQFSKVELEYIYLPMVAFFLEIIGSKLISMDVAFFINRMVILTLILQLLVNGIIIFFLYSNINVPGIKWILIGTALNFIVIVSNFGFMPVDSTLGIQYGFETSLLALEKGRVFAHTLMTNKTNLNILGDWIIIPPPWPLPKTISIGDILIDMGAFLLIFKGMKAGHTKKNSV